MDKPYPGVEGVLDLWIHKGLIDHTHKDALLMEITDDTSKLRAEVEHFKARYENACLGCNTVTEELRAANLKLTEWKKLSQGYYDEAAKGWGKFRAAELRNDELKKLITQALPFMRARHEWKPTAPHAAMIRVLESAVAEKPVASGGGNPWTPNKDYPGKPIENPKGDDLGLPLLEDLLGECRECNRLCRDCGNHGPVPPADLKRNHDRAICGWCAGTGKEGSPGFEVPCRKCFGSGDPTKPTPGVQS